MDSRRFDSLVRSFAAAGTRRRVLAILAAIPLVGEIPGLAPDEVEAEKPRDRIKRRKDANRRKRRNRKHHNNSNKNKKNNNGGGGKGGGNPNACALPGQPCQQNGDCCKGNCFGQRCTNPPNQCGGTNCPAGSTGCCEVDGCCPSPTNQCNAGGLCCAPNCGGKQCGPDGCGNSGTCGSCAAGQQCNLATAQCEGPVCNPQSCPNGCCDANGACQPGTSNQQCGSGGITCFACGPNQTCSSETGTCRDNPPCGPETCPNGCCVPQQNGPDICDTTKRGCTPGGACCAGCCDANNVCQPGTGNGECGLNGSACIVCDPLKGLCDQGRCQCDANNCSGCCSNGPGNPGFCQQGNTSDFCGRGGVICAACPAGTSCDNQGACQCLNTDQSCGAGTNCVACPAGTTCTGQGRCVCTAQSCANGCCENGPGNLGRCLAPATETCGIGGQQCQQCSSRAICTNQGQCQCAPASFCSGFECPCGDFQSCCEGFCCGESCCPPGAVCCGDGLCCEQGGICCGSGDNPNCCREEESCCGQDCCASSETCCGGVVCCGPSQTCCNGMACCSSGFTCDGNGNCVIR